MERLSIVIPSMNEEDNIGNLLFDLTNQTAVTRDTPVYVADNNSTDGTREIVNAYKRFLNVHLVPGGLPSKARNNGAAQSNSEYIVFIDADISLPDDELIHKSIRLAKHKGKDLVTTNIRCETSKKADMLYKTNNKLQKVSKIHKPFSTGMYMLWRRSAFDELGGFDESIGFAEDYHLSKKVRRSGFGIVDSRVLSGDRRFRITGVTKLIRMMMSAFIDSDNEALSTDTDYWDHLK